MPNDGLSGDDAVLCPLCKQHWLLLSRDGSAVMCAWQLCGFRLDLQRDYDDGRTLRRLKEALANAYQEHFEHTRGGCKAELAFSVSRLPDVSISKLGLPFGTGGGGGGGDDDEDLCARSSETGTGKGELGLSGAEEFLCATCDFCSFHQVVM